MYLSATQYFVDRSIFFYEQNAQPIKVVARGHRLFERNQTRFDEEQLPYFYSLSETNIILVNRCVNKVW